MPAKIRLEDRECPLSWATAIVGEWWTVLLLHDAFDGYTRFDEFQANLGISSSMLTARLKTLVDEGLLERRVYQTNPDAPRVPVDRSGPFAATRARCPGSLGKLEAKAVAAEHGLGRRQDRRGGRPSRGRPRHRPSS